MPTAGRKRREEFYAGRGAGGGGADAKLPPLSRAEVAIGDQVRVSRLKELLITMTVAAVVLGLLLLVRP